MKPTDNHTFRSRYYLLTAIQLFVPLFLLWASRFAFASYNSDLVGNPSFLRILLLSAGGLRFDLCVWAYLNSLFILMRFLPLAAVRRKGWIIASDIIYCLTNTVMLAVSCADIPFFRFSGSRLRLPAVADLFNDPNMTNIVISYTRDYWWTFALILLLAGVLAATAWICRPGPQCRLAPYGWKLRSAIFILAAFGSFCAMRGTLVIGRPLSIADAVWYIDSPPETNIVLNTPFCILRSVEGGSRIPQLKFMTDADAESIRSSVHTPVDSLKTLKRKNIMVITLESGSKFWLDSLNDVPQTHKLGAMPFLDSIASRSLVNTHLLATGKRSVEGISAIFGGFPTFGDMLYMSSPYNANTVDSFVSLLKNEGYASRFYFGANHGSYSIDSFLKAMGFDSVIDRDSFADDSHHDGLWGIYDHAMGEYAARNISELQQPFVAGWFTLHLHEPFSVPSYWQPAPYRHNKPGPMRSAEYTDMALRHFFEIARTQPWFNNTIFIITGDHGSRDFKNTPFDTGYIQPHVMFLVYTPDGSIAPRRVTDRVMSQIDIGPTILGLLDYPKTYFALGTDMADSRSPHYALGYFNDQYTVTGTKYLITLSSSLDAPDKVFDITADPLLLNPLSSFDRTEVSEMIHWAQAFLQDYSSRMNSDRLRL